MHKYKQDQTSSRLIGAPKSVWIADILETEIRSGALSNGAPLESENALVERFSVSRNTIRRGLEILNDKGLITTRRGIGSFVTFGGKTIDDRSGWSIALSSGSAELGTRILNLSRGEMDLESSPDDFSTDCLIVDRLRFRVATGQGVSLERSRMIWRESFTSILEQGLTDGSLTKTLRDHGLVVASGDEWASVLPALPEEDARLMGRTPNDPMLFLRRLTRASDGSGVEYVESTLDPDLFGLHMVF